MDGVDGEYSSQVVPKPVFALVTNLSMASPMEPGSRTKLPMWIRGPDVPGDHVIDFLFYYEPTDAIPFIRSVVGLNLWFDFGQIWLDYKL